MRNVFIPATLILTAAVSLAGARGVTSQPPTAGIEGADVLFLDSSGRPGAVDVYVDGVRVERQVLAIDGATRLPMTPGTHVVTVKASFGGSELASAPVDVRIDQPSALSFQNDWRNIGYALTFGSGATSVRHILQSF